MAESPSASVRHGDRLVDGRRPRARTDPAEPHVQEAHIQQRRAAVRSGRPRRRVHQNDQLADVAAELQTAGVAEVSDGALRVSDDR
jgi:hypothetical protein